MARETDREHKRSGSGQMRTSLQNVFILPRLGQQGSRRLRAVLRSPSFLDPRKDQSNERQVR